MRMKLTVGEIDLLITTLQQGTQIFVSCKNEAARHGDAGPYWGCQNQSSI